MCWVPLRRGLDETEGPHGKALRRHEASHGETIAARLEEVRAVLDLARVGSEEAWM